MIVHIVFWRLHEVGLNGKPKAENAAEMKRQLEGLVGVIPGLRTCHVGIDFAHTPDSADVAMYMEFESKEALEAYHPHPAHKEVIAFLKGRAHRAAGGGLRNAVGQRSKVIGHRYLTPVPMTYDL
jgi:hypothetical protein